MRSVAAPRASATLLALTVALCTPGCFAAHETGDGASSDAATVEVDAAVTAAPRDGGTPPPPADAGGTVMPPPPEDGGGLGACAQTVPTAEGGGRTPAGELELRHAWVLFDECRGRYRASLVLTETPDGLEGAPLRVEVRDVVLDDEPGPPTSQTVMVLPEEGDEVLAEGELSLERVEPFDIYGGSGEPGLLVGKLEVAAPGWSLLVYFEAPGCPALATACPF